MTSHSRDQHHDHPMSRHGTMLSKHGTNATVERATRRGTVES